MDYLKRWAYSAQTQNLLDVQIAAETTQRKTLNLYHESPPLIALTSAGTPYTVQCVEQKHSNMM